MEEQCSRYFRRLKALNEVPGGLSCGNCPYKQTADGKKVRWTKKLERFYCHGGKTLKSKGPEDGCAVLWELWGGIAHYAEAMHLVEKGMPPELLGDFSLADWRVGVRVSDTLERLALDEARGQ